MPVQFNGPLLPPAAMMQTYSASKDSIHPFEVGIERAPDVGDSALTFRVASAGNVRTYVLERQDSTSYLDLLGEWAKDFGVRVPLNRRPPPIATFRAPYDALLTDNLVPEMLYGYGDPAVLRVTRDGITRYYGVSTSNDAPNSFPIIMSEDLRTWRFEGFVLPDKQKPAWAADGHNVGDFWAPELHQVQNEFRVYFVARLESTRELCIGVAVAASPEGPFVALDRPILRGGVIDPHVLVDGGKTYLYWKEDTNDVWRNTLNEVLFEAPRLIDKLFVSDEDKRTAALVTTLWPWTRTREPMRRFPQKLLIEAVSSDFSAFEARLHRAIQDETDQSIAAKLRFTLEALKTRIFVQELSPDGTSFVGERTQALCNDLPWEAHVIEGIWVVKHEEWYFMFYAGNDFGTADYGIGVARSSSPLGPFEKAASVFLQTTAEWAGPGHPSVAKDLEDNYRLFLHAFSPGKAGYKQFRALLSLRFEIKDCWPVPMEQLP